MSRSRYRSGGDDTEIRFAIGETSLGSVLVAESERGVVAIAMADDPEVLLNDLRERFAGAALGSDDEGFERRVARVLAFIEAPEIGLAVPLDVRGTAFQRRVWDELRAIPLGQTVSYGDVATRIGAPNSTRAVAQACGANVLAVAIPCHRVVRSDGAISGYRWGVERKRRLLARETEAAHAEASHEAAAHEDPAHEDPAHEAATNEDAALNGGADAGASRADA